MENKRIMTREVFEQRVKDIHGDKYDISKTDINNREDKFSKIKVICKKHGEFEVEFRKFTDKTRHQGCPICGKEEKLKGGEKGRNNIKNYSNHIALFNKNKDRTEERLINRNKFVEKFKSKFGDLYAFDFNKTQYINQKTKICCICKKHGEFEQTPELLLRGYKCPICSGQDKVKPFGYWNNYEHCKEEIKKYKSIHDLSHKSYGCYHSICKNGWKDLYKLLPNEINYHGYNEEIHCVYVYKIEETHSCYVGRSLRIKIRDRQHRNGIHHSNGEIEYDNLYKHCKDNNIEIPQYEVLEKGLTAIQSQEKEEYWLNKFQEEGWNIINKGQVGIGKGSLGGRLKWDYDSCLWESKKYSSKSEMKLNNQSAYNSSVKNGWIDDFFTNKKYPKGYWDNLENCKKVAINCKNFKDLSNKYGAAYKSVREHSWHKFIEFKNNEK